MKEKEVIIIEEAIKLFAKKGYSSTSIQEIVDACGMSKGAFYLYFKSKEALLIAIIQYYFEKVKANVQKFENKNLPPREKFELQLHEMLKTLSENRELIITQAREEALPRNEEVKDALIEIHTFSTQFIQQNLHAIYGERIKDYMWDLTVLLESLINAYVKFLFVDSLHAKMDNLAKYLLRRMDSIVADIEKESPFITEKDVEKLLDVAINVFQPKKDIHTVLAELKKEVAKLNNANLEVSMQVLEEEISKRKARTPVIQGMLSNFQGYKQLEKPIQMIRDFYRID